MRSDKKKLKNKIQYLNKDHLLTFLGVVIGIVSMFWMVSLLIPTTTNTIWDIAEKNYSMDDVIVNHQLSEEKKFDETWKSSISPDEKHKEIKHGN